MGNWSLVGISDEATECEVCGRIELKSTMHLVHEDGSELRAGSSCGARKLGTTSAKMRSAVNVYRKNLEVQRSNWFWTFRKTWKVDPNLAQLAREYGHTEDQARSVIECSWARYCEKYPVRVGI